MATYTSARNAVGDNILATRADGLRMVAMNALGLNVDI